MLIRLVNAIDKSDLPRSSWLSGFPDDVKQPDALRKLAFPEQATPFSRKPSSTGRHAVRRSKEMT